MIRYKYNTQFKPPAPFVHVTLRISEGGQEWGPRPAQLDPAADRTVVPWQAIEELSLEPIGDISIGGVGGHVDIMPLFVLQLEIRLLHPITVEVVAHREEPYVLLGRDVLNQFQVLLDGPELALEIG